MSGTIPFPNGAGGSPPDRRSKMDLLIDELFLLLLGSPCKSLDEIRDKLKPEKHASIVQIEQAIAHVRKHSNEYRWTIPHVKRGRNNEDRLYFVTLLDKHGDFIIDLQHRVATRRGLRGTVRHIANMAKNEVAALRMVSQSERSKAHRERVFELSVDLEYVSKKAGALAKALLKKKEVNGYTGD